MTVCVSPPTARTVKGPVDSLSPVLLYVFLFVMENNLCINGHLTAKIHVLEGKRNKFILHREEIHKMHFNKTIPEINK